jgi:predicted ester cyclase
VRASFESFNAHDISVMERALADNYKLFESGLPADADKKAALASTKAFFTAFPDIKATVTDVWAAGDYVVATGSIAGTNTGPAPDLGIAQPTGKPVRARFFEIFKLQDGKIVEDWLFYNSAAFAAQLGLK